MESLNSYTRQKKKFFSTQSSSKIKGLPYKHERETSSLFPRVCNQIEANDIKLTNRNSPEFQPRVTGPSEKPRFPIPFFLPLFPLPRFHLMHNSVVFEFPEDGAFLKEGRYYTLEAVSLSYRGGEKKKKTRTKRKRKRRRRGENWRGR